MKSHPAWRTPLHGIRDSISFAVAPTALRQGSIQILDALQFAHPAVQLDALFVTAVAMANAIGLDPHDMVVRAKRVIPAVDAFDERLNAARDYAHGELTR